MEQSPQKLGRYTLHDRIAAGGMATVYFGQSLGEGGFSRIVAVKRLHPHLALDQDFAAMLLDEAYLAGRIHHPNVVSILDVVSDAGELSIIMEYVHGETLGRLCRTFMQDGDRIPLDIAAALMVGILNGLHAAHETTNEQGDPLCIVHRDVSPQNVVVGVDGVPRVLDFGVAKAQDRLQSTKSGHVKGKLAYMAAEQLTNGSIDRRADIYGAGVMLWELLAGRRLFANEPETSIVTRILTGEVPPPSRVAHGVPGVFDAITLRALARNPSDRYETARQMASAIERAVPIATPATIGEWVTMNAGGRLEECSRIIRAIDQARTGNTGVRRAAARLPTSEAPKALDQSEDALSVSVKFASPRLGAARRYGLLAAMGALLLSGALAMALPSRPAATGQAKPDSSFEAAKASSPPASSPFTSAVPSSVATLEPSTEPTAPSGTIAKPLSEGPASTAPSAVTSASRRSVKRLQVSASRVSGGDCDPPYSVDPTGVRHYKTACPLE